LAAAWLRCSTALAAICVLTNCSRPDSNRLQGYIEGEFVYVASPLAGILQKLQVQRGATVKAGDFLFQLEDTPEKAAHDEAKRRLAQGQATLADARKGKRPQEIEALEAQLKQANAAREFAENEMARQEKLMTNAAATTEQELDRARTTRDQDRQHVAQLQADLEVARLGSRPDQIAGAEANVRALEAALARAEWELQQKRQMAPQGAVVFDTLYREGEWVAAGKSVVALLPPGNVKLRVFVPETALGSLHVGDSLQVSIDGVPAPVTGKISFISPRAEYTPPVIYSRENRAKFVFLVEAQFEPEVAEKLHPGQPVDVQLNLSGRQ
jgi:HlyD family secretion protein